VGWQWYKIYFYENSLETSENHSLFDFKSLLKYSVYIKTMNVNNVQ